MKYLAGVVNGITYFFATLQENPVFQIIEFVFAILTSLTLIAFRVWKWWNEAKKDGKISKEELEQLIGIIAEGADECSKQMNEHKKEE